MQIVIIAAKSDNDIIGDGRDLVWNLPADEAFFRRQIRHCFLLTGRVSYESPQGADIFAGREDVIILTRRQAYQVAAGQVAHSLPEALRIASRAKARKLCVLGGEEIYRQTIPIADRLIITEVHEVFAGTAAFPVIQPEEWMEDYREDHKRDAENPYDYSFVFYKRRKRYGNNLID